MGSASTFQLSFGDHVHNLNAGQKNPGTAKGLEPQHGPRSLLGRPMLLLVRMSTRRQCARYKRPIDDCAFRSGVQYPL